MTSTTDKTLAIDGGNPIRTEAFPARPPVTPADDRDPVSALESEFASYLDADATAISCRDSAAAYALAFGVLGVSGGEAVVPALAADAAVEAARAAGLTIVPGEVEAESVDLGTRGLARAASERTSVVVAGHAFGHPFAAAELQRVLEPRGLPLIEDASAALGGAYRRRPTGLLGTIALFAFGGTHLLSGDGAVLVTADPGTAAHLRDARDRESLAIDEDAARLALAQLRAADEELEVRRQLAWELTFDLRGLKSLGGMPHSRWVAHGYDAYVVRVRSLLWKRPIEEAVAALNAEGIPCSPALSPSLHLDAAIQVALGDDERLSEEGFPVARRLPGELIALPLHGGLTDLEIADIAAALAKLEAASR